MSQLLYMMRQKSKDLAEGHIPLLMEFPVSPETAPYLVSSSVATLWIEAAYEETPNNPMVRMAVREVSPKEAFTECLEAIREEGIKREWGNVQPITEEGLVAAVEHLKFFGFEELEILCPRLELEVVDENAPPPTNPNQKVKDLLGELKIPTRPSDWIPDNHLVVVPKDRAFVGVFCQLYGDKPDDRRAAFIVHNAARGVAVCC